MASEEKVLKNWEAKRSGSHMSVSGSCTETGSVVVLTRIESLFPSAGDGCVYALDNDAFTHRLLIA